MLETAISILTDPLAITIYKILAIIFVFAMPMATFLTLFERKWSALIQDRIGPNRANIPLLNNFRGRGSLHIAADGLKSFFKEDFVPQGADRLLFTIAPFFGFAAALANFAIIPFAAPIGDFAFQITDVEPGLLYIFAVTSLGVYGTVLAGASSNNKFALLGGTRASAQMLSYEVFIGISLLGLFMVYETTRISEIVALQNTYWFGDVIPKWGVFTQPVGFIMFFAAMIAETKRAPFDAPEGESELVAGYFLEYSGMRFASFMLAEYVAIVGVSALVTTLFFGGYHVPWLHLWESAPAWLVAILQIGKFASFTFFFCWLQLQIRWTVPKFRFDQTMALGWKKMLPLALANTVVTAFVILIFAQ